MHPMFKELFIDTDADDLAAEDDRRHRAPVPAGPAGHDHQARRREPGQPAAAVTGGPRRPQTNPGYTNNRMV